MDQDLERPFINKEKGFSLPIEKLNYLFKPDNIRDGESVNALNRIGGIAGLFSALKTDAKNGLDSRNEQDLNLRVTNYGDNKPIVKEPKTIWEYIIENFEDEMLKILCLAAFVALIIGIINEGWKEGWLDGLAIFIAVIIIVSVTASNNYMKDQQFRKLTAQSENRNINCIRCGQVNPVNIYELLVGDIVQIETGEIIPVDGVLIKANNISADESSITGETNLVRKDVLNGPDSKSTPFLLSGSRVMEGTGEMIILAVGVNSQWGQAKQLMSDAGDTKTPLQEKLGDLADGIGSLGFKAATLTFAAMTIHLIVEKILNGDSLLNFGIVQSLLNYFIIAVTIIVVAVPEGLPLAVTIALAYSVGKMKDENNLVRFLQACETMGGANNICSDKTGTLTKNQMTVTNLWVEDNDFKNPEAKAISRNTLELLCEGICLNSNAHPQLKTDGSFDQIGNKTECALLELAYNLGFDFREVRTRVGDKVKKIIPFSSDRKRMSIVQDISADRTRFRIYSKGAPDILLEKCTHIINSSGIQVILSVETRTKIHQIIKKYADQSLRTLILTHRETMLPGKPSSPEKFPSDDELESRLTIIGIAGIKDPLRDGIKESVTKCANAGVTVRMVTGDNIDTAIAISKEAGILPQNYEHTNDTLSVMEGKTFRQLVKGTEKNEDGKYVVGDITNFRDVTNHLRVLARSSPEDKFILVTGLKQLGHVVAVTGDGTNDAPALKQSDVGFAMGIAGTEVAKEASGIILLDDNFSSIVTAIKWGRNIFDCIRKFLQFQITVNIVAVFMAFMGGVILKDSPLTSIQMLWVNLIMDTLASLALSTEPPTEELLQRKPYSRKESMITPGMWRNIICQAIWQIIVLSIILFFGPTLFGVPSSIGNNEHFQQRQMEKAAHFTIFFNVFVFLQVFNEINARKLKREEINVFENFFNNPLFLLVIVGTIIIQIFLVQFGGKAVKVTSLTYDQHVCCLLIGFSSLLVGYCIKQIPDSVFANFELFQEVHVDVDPNTFEGRMKRPSTLLRKKRDLEGYKKKSIDIKKAQIGSKEIELKMTSPSNR